GFEILSSDEIFGSIRFYDVGAFVWFARIIEWEFLDFSVDKCFDRLLKLQEVIDKDGVIKGTTHRYYIVAKKK
ncbi:MAG: SAM-dependent methyltransferase, partial [Lachnospiraceae bacterium]|nr:SAM-dependent methyltransferase [Lachnospiraceae bacterium]